MLSESSLVISESLAETFFWKNVPASDFAMTRLVGLARPCAGSLSTGARARLRRPVRDVQLRRLRAGTFFVLIRRA